MASRMERYNQLNTDTRKRSRRNRELYDKIYDPDNEYSNIEGIARIEKTNEIDINRIKEMLRKREERKEKYPLPKTLPHVSRKENVRVEQVETPEEKNYDIRDILVKAKSKKGEKEDDQYRSLKNTQYNILKGINLKEEIDRRNYMEPEVESHQLKELIDTITNTSMLNKLGDEDLSLDLLSDLKSNDDTLISSDAVKAILKEEKAQKKQLELEESRDLDKSFYTSSMNFSEEDFEDLEEIQKKLSKRKVVLQIIGGVFVLILVVIIAYFVGKYLL